VIPEIDRKANEAWNLRLKKLGEIDADQSLSEQGKRDFRGRVEAEYRATVEQLQAQGSLRADQERRTAKLALKMETQREIRQLRSAVGDVLAAGILRERLEHSTSAEIQAVYADLDDEPWARAIVGNYGRLVIARRAGEKPTADDVAAMTAMKPKRDSGDVEYENRVKDLEPGRVAKWIANLDRGAYQADIAQRFHVSAKHVPMPEA
jgi:hypothetical protein